ncbi:GTPaseactivator protein [Pelomyxa schiedti]|nr:GTPaseactivator protein [Pelomyxa schiedti]
MEPDVDSAAFLALSDNLKVATGQLKAIMNACERSKVEAKQHSTAGMFFGSDQIADAIFSYSMDLHFSKKSPALATALITYGTIQRKLSILRKDLDQKIKERFVKPITLFIDNDMKRAQTTRQQYDHQKKSFETAKTKLKESETKLDPHKYYALQVDYTSEKQEYENVHARSMSEVTDLDKLKDIELITRLKALMSAHLEYLKNCTETFEKVDSILSELDDARAKETAVLVEKRKESEKATTTKRQQQIATRFNPLIELISTNTCLSALFEQQESSSPSDELFASLARVLDHKQILLPIIKTEITKCITENSDPQVLFRANTLATRLTTALTTIVGGPFLQSVLGPIMRNLNESSEEFEIDPIHVSDPAIREANVVRLTKTIESVLDAILTSTNSFPLPFRCLCAHARKEAATRFNNERIGNTAVGGFIFLRFFCPNIVNPTKLGLLPKQPPKNVFRALVLITKSLQSLANNAEFSAAEEYMKVMDDFIKTNRKLVIEWYDKLTTIPDDWEQNQTPLVSRQELEVRDLPIIEDVCRTYLRKVSKVSPEEKAFFMKFCQVMATLERVNVPATPPEPAAKPPPLRHLFHISTNFIQEKISDYSSNIPMTARPSHSHTPQSLYPSEKTAATTDNITSSGDILPNWRQSTPSLNSSSLNRQQFGTIRGHNLSFMNEQEQEESASPPPLRRGGDRTELTKSTSHSHHHHHHRSSDQSASASNQSNQSNSATPPSSEAGDEFRHLKDGTTTEYGFRSTSRDSSGKLRRRSGSSGVDFIPSAALAAMTSAISGVSGEVPSKGEKVEGENCLSDEDGSGLANSGSGDGISALSEVELREREERAGKSAHRNSFPERLRTSPDVDKPHSHHHHNHHERHSPTPLLGTQDNEKDAGSPEIMRSRNHHSTESSELAESESGSSDESKPQISQPLPLQMCPPLRRERKTLSVVGLFDNQPVATTGTPATTNTTTTTPTITTTLTSSSSSSSSVSTPPATPTLTHTPTLTPTCPPTPETTRDKSPSPPSRSLTSPHLRYSSPSKYVDSLQKSPTITKVTPPPLKLPGESVPFMPHMPVIRETRRRSASSAMQQFLPTYLGKT